MLQLTPMKWQVQGSPRRETMSVDDKRIWHGRNDAIAWHEGIAMSGARRFKPKVSAHQRVRMQLWAQLVWPLPSQDVRKRSLGNQPMGWLGNMVTAFKGTVSWISWMCSKP